MSAQPLRGKASGAGLGSLLKDKRVVIGVAVAGGAGLLVLLMRKGGSGQTTVQPAAGLDSTSGDLYQGMQDLGQRWQQDLQGFADQLKNVQDRLPPLPTGGTGNPPQYPNGVTGQNTIISKVRERIPVPRTQPVPRTKYAQG